jgi:hypothetical protein
MKKSIKNLEVKAIKNIKAVKGGNTPKSRNGHVILILDTKEEEEY